MESRWDSEVEALVATKQPKKYDLAGMGDDGARGMLEMKEAGAFNIAQDEASCVVFRMPSEAIKWGGMDRICPLQQIAHEVVRLCS